MNYFDQCAADGKVFHEHFNRYGAIGMLEAVKNVVCFHNDRRICVNKASVTLNQAAALAECIRRFKEIENEAQND